MEDKWKANQEKVAFMRRFPGVATSWEELSGKTIAHVVALPSKPEAAVVVFSDGSFAVVRPPASEPHDLRVALDTARQLLEPKHREAYVEYDRLARKDRDASRAARLEKILGAIQNNVEQIPELKDRLRRLVDEWARG